MRKAWNCERLWCARGKVKKSRDVWSIGVEWVVAAHEPARDGLGQEIGDFRFLAATHQKYSPF